MEAKNWNDLPVELKVECIKRMDFESRWALRSTSRVEKQLVERTKCAGKCLSIQTDPETSRTTMCLGRSFPDDRRFPRIPIEDGVVETFIRMEHLESLSLTCNTNLLEIVYEISRKIPLDVKFFHLSLINPGKYLSIVDKCRGLTGLNIFCFHEYKFSDVSASREKIFDLKRVCLVGIDSIEPEFVIQLINRWIAVDKAENSVFRLDLTYMTPESEDSVVVDDIIEAVSGNYKIVERSSDLGRTKMLISIRENKYVYANFIKESLFFKVVRMSQEEIDDEFEFM